MPCAESRFGDQTFEIKDAHSFGRSESATCFGLTQVDEFLESGKDASIKTSTYRWDVFISKLTVLK